MEWFAFAIVTVLAAMAIGFGLAWLDAVTAHRPGRHHDHLIPRAPTRYRPAR